MITREVSAYSNWKKNTHTKCLKADATPTVYEGYTEPVLRVTDTKHNKKNKYISYVNLYTYLYIS